MKQLTFLFILMSTICSCGNNKQMSDDVAYDESIAYAISEETAEQTPSPVRETINTENNAVIQRKIIKEGSLRFETANAAKTREAILKSVKENNGYLANDNTNNYGGKTDYDITIRVPAERFDILLEQVSGSAVKIDRKEINALDVTEEYIDVFARIKTKKELEERYKEILKQAHKVEDILKIEREIGTLRSDIESLEGRMRFLNDRVSYSTLRVNFYEKGEVVTSHSFGFGGKWLQALYNGWNNILWFIIGLTNLWPFILIIIAVFIMIKKVRKGKKKQNRKGKNEFPPVQ